MNLPALLELASQHPLASKSDLSQTKPRSSAMLSLPCTEFLQVATASLLTFLPFSFEIFQNFNTLMIHFKWEGNPPPPPARRRAGSTFSGGECSPPRHVRRMWTRNSRPVIYIKTDIFEGFEDHFEENWLFSDLGNHKYDCQASEPNEQSSPPQLPKEEGGQRHRGLGDWTVKKASLQCKAIKTGCDANQPCGVQEMKLSKLEQAFVHPCFSRKMTQSQATSASRSDSSPSPLLQALSSDSPYSHLCLALLLLLRSPAPPRPRRSSRRAAGQRGRRTFRQVLASLGRALRRNAENKIKTHLVSRRSYLANFIQILQILWISLNSKLVFFAKYGVDRKALTGLRKKRG